MLIVWLVPVAKLIRNVKYSWYEIALNSHCIQKTLKIMTSYLNKYANIPWVWPVAQRLEQQPR